MTEDTVLIAHTADGDEEIAVGAGHVKGIVLLQSLPHLSHLGVRARQEGVPFATCDDAETAATVLACKGKRVGIEVATSAVQFGEGVGGGASAKQGDATAKRGAERGAAGAGAGPAPSKRGGEGSGASWVALEDAKESSCGAKAHGCARLARLAASSKAFRAQPGGVLPYGALESALASAGEGARKAFAAHMAALEAPGASAGDISVACTEIQRLIGALAVPADAVDAVARLAAEGPGGPPRLIFRSSSNVEDLKGVSGAGLYESVGNVDPADRGAVEAAVRAVWASLFTPRAVGSRRAAGIPQSSARMAVLVQPMVDPEVSFVVHTVSPLDRDPRTVLVEAAPGLGETLASGARGSPWRLQIDKATGDTTTLTFANFSNALTGETRLSGPHYGPPLPRHPSRFPGPLARSHAPPHGPLGCWRVSVRQVRSAHGEGGLPATGGLQPRAAVGGRGREGSTGEAAEVREANGMSDMRRSCHDSCRAQLRPEWPAGTWRWRWRRSWGRRRTWRGACCRGRCTCCRRDLSLDIREHSLCMCKP